VPAAAKFHSSSAHWKYSYPSERRDVAELKIHIEGLPIELRFSLDEVSAKTLLGAITRDGNLLSGALRKIADQIRGSTRRGTSSPSGPAPTIVEMTPKEDAITIRPASQTVLRVGRLELDLLDRTAKRGDRKIDLRPREFRLLRYMMERSGKLLTRAKLLQEVWNYKFVPQTNLVDVHMGRLRRKVDGPNEPAIIRSVRGAGFVLNADPLTQN
jgi:DNA-binding winged helix-turn-helix (wHTH) protein